MHRSRSFCVFENCDIIVICHAGLLHTQLLLYHVLLFGCVPVCVMLQDVASVRIQTMLAMKECVRFCQILLLIFDCVMPAIEPISPQ